MSYKHLSLEERYYIEIELKRDTLITAIAKALGRSQGSISKEIARNRGKRGYRHTPLHRSAIWGKSNPISSLLKSAKE